MRRHVARNSLLLLAGLLVGAAVASVIAVRLQLPGSDSPKIAGLSAPVEVAFDARDVPTLRAGNLLDATRALGLLHARERLFQMDLQRRNARGELAEIFGKNVLPIDRLHRVYGFANVAEAAVARLPADERAYLEAYAAGVNAWLGSHAGRVGIEFAMLQSPPRPWTAADSLAVLLLMHEDLSTSWRVELIAEKLRALPEARRRFLMPRITDRDVLLVPDAEPRPPPDDSLLFTPEHADSTIPNLSIPADVLGLPSDAGARPEIIGSNNWVIAGNRTKSGKPILANDPHLALRAPGIWYAVRVEWAGRFVQGVSLPGLPGVVIGQNDRLAWGFTNIATDVQDLYREEPTGERRETIKVKGAPAEELMVKLGAHGPQVRPGYSLHWSALDPSNMAVPAGIMEARDWKSFNDAFDKFPGPAQNVVYADIDGHIGWRASGKIPIRADGDDGSVPMDGAGRAHDWRGYVPQDQMPRAFDPPQGYLVTANQRVIGTSFPHLVATRWASPGRARRIVELIEAGGKVTRLDVQKMQVDVVSPALREQAVLWTNQLNHKEWAPLLTQWDGAANAADDKMLVARALQLALRTELHLALLGPDGSDFDWFNDDGALAAALGQSPANWTRAGMGDKQALLGRAQDRAARWLAEQPAKTWGEFNKTQIHHAFGLGGGLMARIFDPPQAPQSGCGSCVRVGNPGHGQSMRLVVDFAEPEMTTLVLPLGQSGHLGSAHRLDQRADWLAGPRLGDAPRTLLKQPAAGAVLTLRPE